MPPKVVRATEKLVGRAIRYLADRFNAYPAPGETLRFKLYLDPMEFRRVNTNTFGNYRDVPAFTDFASLTSHILLRPTPVESDALPTGLPIRRAWSVVHETVHQYCLRGNWEGVRRWPHWFAEGLAESCAARILLSFEEEGFDPSIDILTRACLYRDAHQAESAPTDSTRYPGEPSPDEWFYVVDAALGEAEPKAIASGEYPLRTSSALVMKKRSGKPRALPTILKTRRVLRLALTWAVGQKLIAKAPYPTKTPA